LLAGQKRALELIAGNAPLGDVLLYLTELIESHASDLYCSVLILEGDRLRLIAAPSLPAAFNETVDGLQIGLAAGSCGAAAYTGRPVIVTDIATDPLWACCRDLVLSQGLRACWSTPILAGSGEVLGTFAMYYATPAAPTAAHLRIVELATHIAGIAIERCRTDEALKQRAAMLDEANRRKDEFLAVLAHELRNPLAPIVTALELIRLHDDIPAARERYRKVIERQVSLIDRLVDDLLDISRIKRGKMDLKKEVVTVHALIERALELTEPLITRRRHELSVDLPPSPIAIEADPIRVVQALSNLLNNAAKYTDPGGRITVSARKEAEEAVIEVRDTGIGIAKEMLPRVFELFMQADGSVERSQGGLGIGLTLVRNLIEMHGGRVAAFSEGAGKGSEFVVRLPVI